MRLGLDRLWLFLALALPALASLIVAMPAVDLAWQVRAGEQISTTGAIPAADTFTFTAYGAAWVDQQWLAQVVLALGHRLGGWELLAVLRAGLVATTFGLVTAAALARGAAPRTAAILALAAFVLAAPALALRPQLFGIALFAALLWLVAGRRRRPRALWLAPLLVVAWANVHGSVVLAPVLLGYAWLEDLAEGADHRRSLGVLVAGTIATLVNPFGPGVWAYAIGVGTDPAITEQVAEWQRTSPFTVPGLLFYLSAVAVLALLAVRRGRLAWPAYVWLAALFAVGVWTERGLAWWPLGVAMVVAGVLVPTMPAHRPRPNVLNALTVAVIGLALGLALPWWRPADPLAGREGLLTYAPSGLAQALRERVQPGDRVFVPQTWGSWFEWAVPDARYFVDSRIELFPPAVWRDYGVIAAGGATTPTLLEVHDLRTVVAEPGGALALRLLGAGWTLVYQDAEGVLLEVPG
ncbi:MAG: hypothetical protein AB1627_11140 [Chloroflexota bacterium]